MKILVTGSGGHLGEALMRTLAESGEDVSGLDIKPSPFTKLVGSIADRPFVEDCMRGVEVVLHTATLHKPAHRDPFPAGLHRYQHHRDVESARSFPEEDDDRAARRQFDDDNLKVNEFLHRRADVADVVTAHLLAMAKASQLGFDKLIVSSSTPFTRSDLRQLRADPAGVVRRRCPHF